MRKRWIPGLVVAAGILAAAAIPRDSYSTKAVVIDGDTLKLGTTTVRLHAVDAPEAGQACGQGAARWSCGTAAASKLAELVGNAEIVCQKRDVDQYGRTVAVCRNGKTDLGAALVTAGFALAYRQYGDDYIDEEDEAHAARRGMWADDFTPPWEWRQGHAEAPTADPPAPPRTPPPSPRSRGDCVIKGNINAEGERIYHVPGGPNYDATIIDPSKGERLFCSVQEAENAGWRAPRGR